MIQSDRERAAEACLLTSHQWEEAYYGWRCANCGTFSPYGSEPWLPDEEEPTITHDEFMVCLICGCGMEWERCWNGCDDGYNDLYDEDPLLYDEDDTELCSVCDGRGGWWVCPGVEQHGKDDDHASQVETEGHP